jgi:hypothetical protein
VPNQLFICLPTLFHYLNVWFSDRCVYGCLGVHGLDFFTLLLADLPGLLGQRVVKVLDASSDPIGAASYWTFVWFSQASMCQSSFTRVITMCKARELAIKKNNHGEIKQNMNLCSRTSPSSRTSLSSCTNPSSWSLVRLL